MALLKVVVTETGELFSLAEAKQHLRVDTGDDDALIESQANAAVAFVLQYCNLSMVPAGDIPKAAFRAAALIALGDLYQNREPVMTDRSPIKALIDPYRWLRV